MIARDELAIHVECGIMRFLRFYSKELSHIAITNIVKESVELELEFARSLIPNGSIENLHLTDVEGHVKNLGNFILERLGVTQFWVVDRASLPPWLSFLNLRPRANFYERPVSEYQTPKAVSERHEDDVDF
jgi:ribonucleotide reductase beta subunit family protein with ferritin-like domain